MTIIFPFFSGDAPQLLNLLQWVRELGGCSGHNAVLVADESVTAETAMSAVAECRKSFDETELISCAATQGWPQGPNALWLAAAKHVKDNKLGAWLFMEPDAVPLKEGWASTISKECDAKSFFFGHIYDSTDAGTPPQMLSGVAVYPEHAIHWREVITPGEAFDVSLSRMISQYWRHTDLIHHIWGETRALPPVFVPSKTAASPRNSFGLEQIKPQAVIFHRNKDGSLINLLREQHGIKPQSISKPLPRIALVYIYPNNGNGGFSDKALQFAQSYEKFPPGMEHETVIVCNGAPATEPSKDLFNALPNRVFIDHDNSGWDIGGFQIAARTIPCELMVFFSSHTYFRKAGWLARMWEAYCQFGDTLYGCTGNQGDFRAGVHPHVRTTGFWMSRDLFNQYPHRITQVGGGGQRYGFEHGPSCLTNWVRSMGLQAWVVGWDCMWPVTQCDQMPGGFHNGTQYNILVGDRLTGGDYWPHP